MRTRVSSRHITRWWRASWRGPGRSCPSSPRRPCIFGALPSHLEEASSYLEGLRPRVRCQAVFAPVLQPLVARLEGAELVIDESVGPGIVAEAADGSVIVDNTLAARLAQIEARLEIELVAEVGDGRP